MDELAQSLLGALKKSSAPIDSKLNLFNNLKSHIKHQRVPESAQPPTVECIRLAISSQTSSTLVTTGFSTLNHLIKRLTLQDQVSAIFAPRINVLGALLDRLGDAKESYRSAASQCLCDLWSARPGEVEKMIKEGAILGSNTRAKDAGIGWVVKMHEEHNLQFKAFVPPLIDCLDHADGTVRERAKLALCDLFRDASDRAQADLKRQLIAKGVRKSIASHILSQLNMPVPSELATAAPAPSHVPSRPQTPHHEPPAAEPQEPVLPPSQETSHIDPLYIGSQRELEDAFRTMQPHFEGRESEGNWMARDNDVLKLRRYLKGNAPEDYHAAFTGHIRQMLDSILKVVNSLRTTMSTNGCHLVQELARTLGPAIDPMVELLMQNMMKLCSATKNIAAQNGNQSVDVLLSHVTYNVRLVQHVWHAVQDKNAQPRIFAAGWLKTLMKKQTHNKSHFEHSGGLELVEKSINKALADANPKVRENMRSAYWAFSQIWHDRAETIINKMDAKSRGLLEKDPSNPNAGQSSFTSSVGPGAANPRAAASNARSTLKDTIAAQKKAALAAKRMPDRPNSAMANLSPVKEAGRAPSRAHAAAGPSTLRGAPSASSQSSTSKPATSSTGHNSLMSGPVRRPKRPDVPRPATADPYANRRLLRAESPPSRGSELSPQRSASKSSTSSTVTQKKTQASSRPGTSGTDRSSRAASPRVSPEKQRPKTIHGTGSVTAATPKNHPAQRLRSPSAEENMTMVAPSSRGTMRSRNMPQQPPVEDERPQSSDSHSGMPTMAGEDDFTLVMPTKMNAPQAQQHRTPPEAARSHQSPRKSAGTPTKLPTPSKRHTPQSSRDEPMEAPIKGEVEVHEDASAVDGAMDEPEEPPRAVLQELPANEQVLPPPIEPSNEEDVSTPTQEDIRSTSPTKKGIAMTIDGSNQERAEVMKNRRILSSGIERLKAKTLDAHGFRRLQDLVKLPSHDQARLMSELLLALVGYIEAVPESLRVNATKAISLKSQALSTLRSVAALHRGAIEVRQEFPAAVCSTLIARQMVQSSPHFAADLEKTANEIVKHAGGQVGDVLDGVLDYVHEHSAGGEETHRSMTMALAVLSKLQIAMRQQSRLLNAAQKQQLGKLAVRFLDDRDPDVRRADTELCLELFGHFGEEGKEEYWGLLRGAKEAQLNLVAYYLARRVQSAR